MSTSRCIICGEDRETLRSFTHFTCQSCMAKGSRKAGKYRKGR